MLEQAIAQDSALQEATAEVPEPEPHLDESALAKLPPEIAARLRALRELRSSLAARNVDFDAWKRTAYESRR